MQLPEWYLSHELLSIVVVSNRWAIKDGRGKEKQILAIHAAFDDENVVQRAYSQSHKSEPKCMIL